MVKACFKCGEERPVEKFYRHPQMSDGRLGKCVYCARKDVTENRRRKLDYYRAYDRSRGHRGSSERDRVYRAVRDAIKQGRLTREPCEKCGNYIAQAHHANGYDEENMLDVQWLCKLHHMEEHIKI